MAVSVSAIDDDAKRVAFRGRELKPKRRFCSAFLIFDFEF
jgi:hypothetical protein